MVKPHGLRGEVWLELSTDFPERLMRQASVELAGPHSARPVRIQGVRSIAGQRAIVKLLGVDDRSAAEAIRGHVLRVERTAVPPPPDGAYYGFQIVGLRVVSTTGRDLGRVREILRTGANDVYETDRALIPAIADVVREIDLERGEILVEDVEGLLK